MPECHNCPWNGKGSERCLKCAGPADANHHGRTYVSIDCVPDAELAVWPQTDPSPPDSRLAEFMRHWVRMRPGTRDILALLLANPHVRRAELARKLSISPQALHARLLTAARNIPALRRVLRLSMKPVRRMP